MKIIEEMSKYQKLYEICLNDLKELIEKERELYSRFLVENQISIVSDPYNIVHYFSIDGQVTKDEVNRLYEKWQNN